MRTTHRIAVSAMTLLSLQSLTSTTTNIVSEATHVAEPKCSDDIRICPAGSVQDTASRNPLDGCNFYPCNQTEVYYEKHPSVGCQEDSLTCADGTTLVRDPNNNCQFPVCKTGTINGAQCPVKSKDKAMTTNQNNHNGRTRNLQTAANSTSVNCRGFTSTRQCISHKTSGCRWKAKKNKCIHKFDFKCSNKKHQHGCERSGKCVWSVVVGNGACADAASNISPKSAGGGGACQTNADCTGNGEICYTGSTSGCDSDCGDRNCSGVCTVSNGNHCGGFAGLQCLSGFRCADAKGDCCSPQCGGRDCIGICVAN